MSDNEKADYWREQISQYRASGLTMKAWCASHQIAFGQMKYWIRKLGLQQRKRKAPTTKWIEVTPESPAVSSLVVHVGTAAIDVPAGFDAALLKQVVQALGERS